MKNSLKSGILVLLVVSFCFTACRNEQKMLDNGQKQIPKMQMIRLMADIELTESALKLKQVKMPGDSLRLLSNRYYDSLYSFYKVTPAQFRENLKYYQRDLEEFQAMMDSVIITLTRHNDSTSHPVKSMPSAGTKVKK